MVSGTISLPLTGYFSPFARATITLSVVQEYLALRGGPRGFTPGFPCLALLGITTGGTTTLNYGAVTLCGRPSHAVLLVEYFVTP